ncbi:hypothetical protein ACKVCA_00160 (plasmid) [Escherichia coli]
MKEKTGLAGLGIVTAEAVTLLSPRYAAGLPAQSASHALTGHKNKGN